MNETANVTRVSILEKIPPSDATEMVPVPDDKFELRFDYLGWPLIARLTPHASGSLHMQLLGKVGRVPFSAEGKERRIGAMMLLRSTMKRRPTRFAVTKSGEVALAGDIEVVAPVTPAKVITVITTLLASVKPYLDLFPLFVDSNKRISKRAEAN
jgi:hypothetical protein